MDETELLPPQADAPAPSAPRLAPEPVAPAAQPAPAEPKPADKGPTMRESVAEALKSVRERPRNEIGQYAKVEKAPEVAPAAQPAPDAAQKPAKVERPADMPKAWGADKAAIWQAMTPEQRAIVTERETQMEGFHSKFGGLKQYADVAAQNGYTLTEVLDRVTKIEDTMAADPARGLLMASEIVGLSHSDTVRALQRALMHLGVNPGQMQPQPNGQAHPQQGALPPVIETLAARLAKIEESQATQAQKDQAARLAKAQAEVDGFFADPKNEFAEQLREDIVRELQMMKAAGLEQSLPTAYERAMWTRPDLRETLVTKQIAQAQEQAKAAQAQALEKSRSASRSVAGSPPLAEGRSSAAKPANLRDEVASLVRARQSGRV